MTRHSAGRMPPGEMGITEPPGTGGSAPGAPPGILAGWGALVLALLLASWGAAPWMRRPGPDLAALVAPDHETARALPGGAAVPPQRLPPPAGSSRRVKGRPGGRVDLNRATPADLMALPGIGPALAARIVAHRQTVGPFARIEALRAVPGIGPKRYERLAPFLTVGAPAGSAGERDRP